MDFVACEDDKQASLLACCGCHVLDTASLQIATWIGSAQMPIRIQSITFDPPHFHMSTQISIHPTLPLSSLPRISPDRALVFQTWAPRMQIPSHSTPKTGQTLPEKQPSEASPSKKKRPTATCKSPRLLYAKTAKPSKTTRSKSNLTPLSYEAASHYPVPFATSTTS